MTTENIEFKASTIETIDTSIYEWIENSLNLHTTTNKGLFKVPVLWLGTERTWQIKNDQRIRDKVGKLILPLVTINRDSITKDPSFKGSFQANLFEQQDYKGGSTPVDSNINQDKTQNFQNSIRTRNTNNQQQTGKVKDNNQIIYNTYNAPIPVYINTTYSIILRTEYQQQMNEMIQPFITTPGTRNCVIIENNNHKFEAFIQSDYAMQNTVSDMSEKREYETTIEIKVVASLIGDSSNQETPKYAVRQNAVELKITREVSILDPDEIERLS